MGTMKLDGKKVQKERIIRYSDSDSGKAYIGIAKRPLMKVEKGHGYKGVLIQTEKRDKVQCHICGKWMDFINAKHLDSHQETKETYCKTFSLNPANSLTSDAYKYKMEDRGRKTWIKHKEQMMLNLKKGYESQARDKQKEKGKNDRVEYQNQYATCEKQLEFRIMEFIKQYKYLPTRRVKGEGERICSTLIRRYGSVNKGFKHYGLPIIHRTGFLVKLVAPNGKSIHFDYRKNYNREAVYSFIAKNCRKDVFHGK